MGGKEGRGPQEIEHELRPPQPYRPAAAVALEGAPAGHRDEHIEHGPERREYPGRWVELRLVKPSIPSARRSQESNYEPAAYREDEKPNQHIPTIHRRS